MGQPAHLGLRCFAGDPPAELSLADGGGGALDRRQRAKTYPHHPPADQTGQDQGAPGDGQLDFKQPVEGLMLAREG